MFTHAIDFKKLLDNLKILSEPEDKIWNQESYEYFEWHAKDQSESDLKTFQNDINLPHDIKRIRFISGADKRLNDSNGLLDITYTDGRKATYLVSPSQYKEVASFLKKINAAYWEMLQNMPQKKLDWHDLPSHYGIKGFKDYEVIHQRLLNELGKQFQTFMDQHPETATVNIIDAGCGQTPEFLISSYDLVKKSVPNTTEVSALGFDFEPTNIKICKEKNRKDKQIDFKQGDLNDIENILKSQSKEKSDKTCNVVLSSGTLTRCVLNNSFEALNILQRCWRGDADLIIMGGEREMLFVRRMLKKSRLSN